MNEVEHREQLGIEPVTFTEDDLEWLANLGIQDISSSDLPTLNGFIEKDINLGPEGQRPDDALREKIIENRNAFFGLLTNIQQAVEYLRKFSPNLIPIATFINSQRYLWERGFNTAKLINNNKRVLYSSRDYFEQQLEALAALGLDTPRLSNQYPSILLLSPETAKDKLDNIEDLGWDALELVNKRPRIMAIAKDVLRERVKALQTLGINTAIAVRGCPQILEYSTEWVKQKLKGLEALGFDGLKMISADPKIITYGLKTLKQKLDNLNSLGLDAIRIASAMPAILAMSEYTISMTVFGLKELGIWEEVKHKWHLGLDFAWLITPVESIMIWLDKSKKDQPVERNQLRKFVQSMGLNDRQQRQAYVAEKLGLKDLSIPPIDRQVDSGFVNSVGNLAVYYAWIKEVA